MNESPRKPSGHRIVIQGDTATIGCERCGAFAFTLPAPPGHTTVVALVGTLTFVLGAGLGFVMGLWL